VITVAGDRLRVTAVARPVECTSGQESEIGSKSRLPADAPLGVRGEHAFMKTGAGSG
jgi:hypothetical protein